MPLRSDKRLDEVELRVARLERWLDTLKEHADRRRPETPLLESRKTGKLQAVRS